MPVVPAGGSPKPPPPPTIVGTLPGGAAVGLGVSLPSLARALEAIRRLVAIGALDGALIAGVGSLGGGPNIALPELQRPTSLSVQGPGGSTGLQATTPAASTSKGVTFGDNATSKLRSHWGDIQKLAKEHGVKMPGKFKEAGAQIRSFIEDVVRVGETRVGPYKPTGGGWPDALWTKHGNTIVIRSPEGKFVTILDAAGGGAAVNFPGGL